MLLKTAICDDDKRDIETILQYLKKYEMENDINFVISSYQKSPELMEHYQTKGAFDLLFLDVEMPKISGLKLARHIRDLPDHQAKIIFISSYPKYMQDSFNVQAFHYLDKPLSYAAFCEVMELIVKEYRDLNMTKLLLCSDSTEVLVHIEDILYIETDRIHRGYLTFFLTGRQLSVKGKINDWAAELATYSFVMPYKGILVNLSHVHYIENKNIILTNGNPLPLSRKYEQELRNTFSRHVVRIHQHR